MRCKFTGIIAQQQLWLNVKGKTKQSCDINQCEFISLCVSGLGCFVSATVGCTESGGSFEPLADSDAPPFSFIHTSRLAMSRHAERFLAVRVYCAQKLPTTTDLWLSRLFFPPFFGPYFVVAAWLWSCPTSLVGPSNRLPANQRITWQQFSVFKEMMDWDSHSWGFLAEMPDSGYVWSELFITPGS